MANEEFKFPDEQGMDNEVRNEDVEVEIEIVDDTPPQDRGRKPLDREVNDPTDDEIEGYSDNVKKRIKELTHARHDERRAKEALLREKQELERLAYQMIEENKRLKGFVDNGNQVYATTVAKNAEMELEAARRKYKEAQEAFDTDAIIAAQEALTEAKLKYEAAKNFRPAPLQQQEVEVQIQQPAPQQVRPDETALRWQAKNQWFGAQGFEELTSYALGLHQKLVQSGIDPRSEEYYGQIDARVRSKFPEVFGEQQTSQPRSGDGSKRPSSVVAPASRTTGARKVQLTPSQAALVKRFNLDPKKYAEEVLKLEKSNG